MTSMFVCSSLNGKVGNSEALQKSLKLGLFVPAQSLLATLKLVTRRPEGQLHPVLRGSTAVCQHKNDKRHRIFAK